MAQYICESCILDKFCNDCKTKIGEVELYNQYIQGNCYCLVKEIFNLEKEHIDYDICGGYIGYEHSEKDLKNKKII